MKIYNFLSITLFFLFAITGTSEAKNKNPSLTGIWKQVFSDNEPAKQTPVTFVFTKNSDSVLIIEGYGYKERFYKYTINGDSLLIHHEGLGNNFTVGKIHKSRIEFNSFDLEKLKVPKLGKEFDQISIIPINEEPFSYKLRFSKFNLSYNGKYSLLPDPELDFVKTSGKFNKIVFPLILYSLENLKDAEESYSPLIFKILFYKNGKLIKEEKNIGTPEMAWIFQFINLYTYTTY